MTKDVYLLLFYLISSISCFRLSIYVYFY